LQFIDIATVRRDSSEFTWLPVDLMTSEGNETNASTSGDDAHGEADEDAAIALARDDTRAAASDKSLRASTKDRAHFTRGCRMKALYPADLAAGSRPLSDSTIDRRLSGLAGSAEVDERYVQKLLDHASAEMTAATGSV
jgi:hypothetical protein